MLGVLLRIERLQVIERLPHPDKPDRQTELAAEGGDRTTPRAAIELGDYDAGGRDRFREQATLLDGVLSHRAVEDQEGLVWRARQPPPDDADDLPQLVHQPFLGVESAGGVH